jgi:hypothetical protein
MARNSGGPATTTWRRPPDQEYQETIKFCQPVERCPSRTVNKVSSATHLLRLQYIAVRAPQRLDRLVLLILWWEGQRADPGEKRGPRKTLKAGAEDNSKCLTSTRRIEKCVVILVLQTGCPEAGQSDRTSTACGLTKYNDPRQRHCLTWSGIFYCARPWGPDHRANPLLST